jgi:DNA (cytosine-5)-methyltransferase 1
MSVVSLFSGCGGMDLGFINAGFNVIWANDFDKYAVKSYEHNLGNHIREGSIQDIPLNEIPEHSVLIGGFPCQPFSMMGTQNGFLDELRGTLFFNIAQIMDHFQPQVAVLENVRNLRTHDNGNTFNVIVNTLSTMGYTVYDDVLNSSNFGIPQTRNRLFLICIRNDIAQQLEREGISYEFPAGQAIDPNEINLQGILETNVPSKYYLSRRILPTILSHGTGGYYSRSEIDLQIARPLTATMAKMHRANQDNYVTDPSEEARALGKTDIRRLTPRECARLQGFPENYEIVVSDTQAYKQFGNAVTVNVAEQIALSIRNILPNIIEADQLNVTGGTNDNEVVTN